MDKRVLSIAILTGVFSVFTGGLSIAAIQIREVSDRGILLPKLQSQTDDFSNNQRKKASQSNAKQIVRLMAKTQMAWRIQHNEFSKSFDRLEIGVPSESQDYHYSIHSSNSSKFVQNLATAKTKELKNYLSLVVLSRDRKGSSFLSTTTCVGSQLNQRITQNISSPKMKDGDPVCPKGYEKVID